MSVDLMRKLPSTFSPSCLFKVLILVFLHDFSSIFSVGPVVNCHMPKDRVTQTHQGYGFVEFLSEDDADYAIKILNMIKLFGKPGFFFLFNNFYNRVSQFESTRRHRIRRIWMLVPTCLLEIWTQKSTRSFFTIHFQPLE